MNKINISKEQIYDLYITQNIYAGKCQEILGISRQTWKRLLEKYKIYKQPCTDKVEKISEAQIKELYFNQNLTSHECQAKLGIGRKSWKRLVAKYNIKKTQAEINKKREETNIKIYGCSCSLNNENIRKKARETCMRNYGVEYALSSKEVRKKAENTLKELYGVDNYAKSAKYHKTMKENFATGEPQRKQYETKKKNNTLGHSVSIAELKIKNLLEQKFGIDDIIHQTAQYKELFKIYPWNCDFYIKSLDLFIEYQGDWRHGKKPFDKNDKECKKLLSKWYRKYQNSNNDIYLTAFHRYTIKDPKKRRYVKEHNINWKELWSMQEAIDFINSL